MGKDFDNQTSEAETLVSAVRSSIPRQIMGKIAIEIMRAEGSANWRQMEWIGFWGESHDGEKTIWFQSRR